jgi:hypothetical protein
MLDIDLEFFELLRSLPYKEAVLKAALWYAARGFKVIPLLKGTKKLGVAEQYASSDPVIIKQWYGVDFIEGNISLLIQEHDLSVIDGDRHGDVDGFKNAGISEADFDGLVAATPHNGLHLYVRGAITYKRLPKGIEHKTSRVIVPPSVIDDVPYEWRTGGVPQELPPQLARAFLGLKLVSSNVKPLDTQLNREQIFAQASLQNYTSTPVAPLGYVKRLLEHMDPGCDYDEWSKIGMAMHHNDDSDLSMEAWRDFSMLSAKFKIGECERKWTSFSQYHSNPITLRWLILTAKQNGCPDSPEDITYYGVSITLDMEVEKMNKKYIYRLMRNGARICWLEKTDKGQLELCQWREQDWKSLMQNQYILVGTKPLPAAEVWLHSALRRTGDVGMWEIGKEPPNALNIYQGLAIEPVKCKREEVRFFLDFISHTICRDNVDYYNYLLDLLAFKVQQPLSISGVCLVLQGGEGTGKGSLCRVMETIMGQAHSMAVSRRDSLLGEYCGGLIAGALWVTANEAVWAGHHGEAERLKALITEPNLEWNDKYTPMWSQRNCIQLSITTNNNWAVPADFDSRRFFVLRIADDKAKDEAYWNEFNALLGRDASWRPINPEYMGKVLYFLQQRKITSSFVNALETEWLTEQRGQTIIESEDDAFVSWVRLFLQETANDVYIGQSGECSFPVVQRDGKSYIISSDLYKDYRLYVRRHFHGRKPYTNKRFNEVLHMLGIEQFRVKKESLMLGQSKYPGEPESKVNIAKLVSANELEKALTANYKLLTADIEDAED